MQHVTSSHSFPHSPVQVGHAPQVPAVNQIVVAFDVLPPVLLPQECLPKVILKRHSCVVNSLPPKLPLCLDEELELDARFIALKDELETTTNILHMVVLGRFPHLLLHHFV